MVSTKDTEANALPPQTGEDATKSAVSRPIGASGVEQPAPDHKPKRRPSVHERSHDGDLPETYGRDEVEILSKDPHWYFIYWEVTDAGFAAAHSQLGLSEGDGRLVLRIFVTTQSATSSGREHREIRDLHLHTRHGKKYLESPRAGAHLRAAVGLLTAEGLFSPIAQSQPLRLPPTQPSTETAVEWAHVQPVSSDGKQREHIVLSRPDQPHKERALPWRTGSTTHAHQLPVHESEWIVDAPSGGAPSSSSHPPGKSGGL